MNRTPSIRRRTLLASSGALVLGAAVGASVSRRASAAAPSNAVIDWYRNSLAATAAAGLAPAVIPAFSLTYAMVQGAVYDAVNSIDRGYQPYLISVPSARPSHSQEAAAAAAAHRVLVNLYPAQQATLDAKYASSLASIPDGPAKDGGISDGEQAAAAMIAARQNDGRDADVPVVIGTAPGQWRPTPPNYPPPVLPWLGQVKPFLVPDVTMFRTAAPYPLNSTAYAQDFNEVKALGARNSTVRTQAQTDTALFWQFGAGDIPTAVASDQGLNLVKAARMLAMQALATADAAIACFYNKYYWMNWRPITAIQDAGDDGNPLTDPDPDWTPLIDTPGHPNHPAGHTSLTTAQVRSLAYFYGTDQMTFSVYDNLNGTTRTYDSFSQVTNEVIDARVWGGIHTRYADIQGDQLGQRIAAYMHDNYFHPVD